MTAYLLPVRILSSFKIPLFFQGMELTVQDDGGEGGAGVGGRDCCCESKKITRSVCEIFIHTAYWVGEQLMVLS